MGKKYMQRLGLGLFLLVFLPISCCSIPDKDLCHWMNGRKYYIDVGESGFITAENITSITTEKSSPMNNTLGNNAMAQIPQRCSVELITCPSCHFRLIVERLNIPTCSLDGTCRCDFLWLKEAAYTKSGQEYCGVVDGNSSAANLVYESKTKLVSVDFLYTGSYNDAFTIQFSAIKNIYVYRGGYDYHKSNSTGVITSPNFPGGYPSDYSAEYVLQNVDTTGYVQLLFTDFQLSLWSYMEILDSNGSRIDVYNGNTVRPPALSSSGPAMTVKFQANDEYPSSGFRAAYTFVSSADKYWLNRPSTDCGGFVEDYGGAITMMNMVPGNMLRAFDCIWLVRPRNAHVPGMQISVRVSQFEEMGSKSSLTIRQGLYSENVVLECITPFQHHNMHRGQEYVVPAPLGLYIRLIGYFNNRSHIAIIYSTFKYEGCFAVGDFECDNGRCIKASLRCDGFNHCGDGSDEAACYGAQQDTSPLGDSNWWRTLTPNYYFPKPESGSSTGTNTLILITSLAGLGMFVLTTVVILVKLHKQRHEDSISREILRTISADIEAENSQNQNTGASDLPLYDPPPSYDEVLKLYLPPPPPYSTIGRNQSRRNRLESANSLNTSPSRTRGRGARKKLFKQNTILQGMPENTVLQVTLPVEENGRHALTSSHTNSDSKRRKTHSSRLANGMTIETHKNQVNGNTIPIQCNESPPPYTLTDQTTTHFTKVTDSPSHKSNNCECQGACSCNFQNVKPMRATTNDLRQSSYEDNNDSIGENTNMNSSCTQNLNVITMQKSPYAKVRNKSSKQNVSKSAGPSSPKDLMEIPPSLNIFRSDMKNCDILSMMSHRRSSSDPSEISDKKLDGLCSSSFCNKPHDSVHNPNPITENLQCPANCKNTKDLNCNCQSKSPDKNDKSWGILWNPTKRKSEKDQLSKSVATLPWTQCDTQPLINTVLSSPCIAEIPVHKHNHVDNSTECNT